MKLKLALPVLAVAISTSVLAASDTSRFTPDGYPVNNRKAVAVAPDSNSSAGLNRNAINSNDDRASNLIASLSPNGSKSRNNDGVGVKGKGAADNNAINDNNPVQNGNIAHSPEIATRPASPTDTCMGSKSTGMQLPVVGGISFGSSWTDKNCMMIKNARELWNMGYKSAALARMCMDDGNREALESSGIRCPVRRTESSKKAESTSLTYLQ